MDAVALLSDTNPHPMDAHVQRASTGHAYIHTPSNLRAPCSVTGFVSAFFNTFDADAVIARHLPQWRINPNHKYYALLEYWRVTMGLVDDEAVAAEMKRFWERKGKQAAEAGTRMHEVLELYAQSQPTNDPEYEFSYAYEAYDCFAQKMLHDRGLRPYRAEMPIMLVADGFPVLAGTVDFLMRDAEGVVWIVDYKRQNPTTKGLLGVNMLAGKYSTEPARPPFDRWYATSFNQYSLQLLTYKFILESPCYGMKVGGCLLVQIHEDISPDQHYLHVVDINPDPELPIALGQALEAHTLGALQKLGGDRHSQQEKEAAPLTVA